MKIREDRGSALVDFLAFGLLLQVPVLFLAIQFGSIQSSQMAADSIARHALRGYVLQGIELQTTANQIANDFQLLGKPEVKLNCSPDCSSTASVLRVTVKIGVVAATSVMIR